LTGGSSWKPVLPFCWAMPHKPGHTRRYGSQRRGEHQHRRNAFHRFLSTSNRCKGGRLEWAACITRPFVGLDLLEPQHLADGQYMPAMNRI
jgi:hypothetical protein